MSGRDPSALLLVLAVAAVWCIPYAVAGVRWLRTRR